MSARREIFDSAAPTSARRITDDPLWFKDAVIYQLHVKSFFDGNDDGIGDFAGLIEKLDYIVALGVTAIWLLPFFPSPRRDDGYDIARYEDVHPDYGTMADASRFIDAAHARGLRVIIELVINHTSDQHAWFQRARNAPRGSPERDFYVWSDTDQAYAGTRIIFCDSEKSNWTFDPVAGQYYWHRFYSHQPDLNFDNPAVLDAVLGIMRFWLGLGVDGLRLDAVPYLIEREGTSNENLPETHAILKRIRAEVDAHYPGRMLLAEANMWPEDTQQYFGDVRDGAGDECHMAFHFPLMPRMYMAIAREDRFPITDIMRQTPEIPENCQWAIFLRNHDELTLEMVTDSERDYLWETYAADRRARINLGIRRRLAPLLQRDRRRIELMTALLLTFPGTPVLYYGDEIGMGDTIHLGDRDGVRTPMQWSIDRNGGFSRSDPAALILPPIMDPLYGYAAINVEAQERDQYSQLNWTRRVLAVRERHRAFGRGTQEFLYPRNRKIMAYLRELDGDTMLCVANLSRTLQAVELDLGRFETRVPVDVIGGAAFPPIGKLPYLLTLPPYGFYAFQLASNAALPSWHIPAPEPMPEFRTLVLRQDDALGAVLGEHRATLERDVMPAYLARRRWFSDKNRDLASVRIDALGAFGSGARCEFARVIARFDRDDAAYQLPLGIVWDDADPGVLAQQLAIARVRRGRRVGYLTDAFAIEAFARELVAELAAGAPGTGRLRFHRFTPVTIDASAPVTWVSGEQSNSSLLIGDAVIVKLLRRLTAGLQPEQEFARVLAASGFANAPVPVGEVTFVDDDGRETLLALVHGFVRNQGDGWVWATDYLRRAVEDWRVASTPERRDEIAKGYATFAARIGQRLAELHAVLATVDSDPAFAPRPIDPGRAEALLRATAGEVARALREARATAGDDAFASLAAIDVDATLRPLAERAIGSLEMRIHGDFHLGQLLVSADDVYFVDFEGEPARSLDERRAKASPLRDLAGLLRSFDYVGQSVRRLTREDGSALVGDDVASDCLDRLSADAARCAVEAYRRVLASAPRPWVDASRLDDVTRFFVIAKAAYEVEYEAANRPTWLPIPIAGLQAVLPRMEPQA
ncbi:MAG: maltose alpha-D-glucosyltransferase [Rhodanobacteraceae bacterium]